MADEKPQTEAADSADRIKMDDVGIRTLKRAESILGLVIVGLIVAGCFLVLRPFVSVILWAIILCYCTWPVNEWLCRATKGRRAWVATFLTLVITALLVLPLVLAGLNLAQGLEDLVGYIRSLASENRPEPPGWLLSTPWLGDFVRDNWGDWLENRARTIELLRQGLMNSHTWILRHSIGVAQAILQIFLSVFIAFFFYRDGHTAARFVSDGISRLAGNYTLRLLQIAGATVKSVVFGIIGAALAQGIAGFIGYLIVGAPSALLLGVITGLVSPLPVAPALIWISVTVWLVNQGHIGLALFMGIYGLVVISSVDNLVKVVLISRGARLSFLLVFLGVVGGVMAFGPIGVFLGPTLLAVGHSLIGELARANDPKTALNSIARPPAG